MAKKSGQIIPPFIIGDKANPWGGLNTAIQDPRFLERGQSYDSNNWITSRKRDNIQLRRGKKLLGQTNREGNRITGLGIGTKRDGTQVPFFTYDRKFMLYDASIDDTEEVDTTDILPVAADGDDVNITPYSNLAGSFVYLTSLNSSIYKINVANPRDVVDEQSTTYKFNFARIYQSRTFAIDRKGDTKDSLDPTGLYMSWTDRQTLADYPAATVQGTLFTGDGSTQMFSGVLVVPAKNTIFYISITTQGATETFFDDGDGNLNSNLGGTGTINYATGAFTVNFFTAPLTGQIGTATFNTEDATSEGVCDFSFDPATRVPFTGELLRQDDGGGKGQAVFPFNGVEYCFHVIKSWQLTLATDDTSFNNLPYFEQIGIPNQRAAFPSGEGIIFINVANPTNPALSILTIPEASTNLTVVPIDLSTDSVLLTPYNFDAAVVIRAGNYDLLCCTKYTNGKVDNFNSVTFIRDIDSGVWNKLDYTVNVLAEYTGGILAGDSLSSNVYTLFSGFDDDGELIENFWNNAFTNLGLDGLKKVGYFNLQGLIQNSQKVKVSYSLDNGPYVLASSPQFSGIIDGQGSYVNKSSPVGIGTFAIGANVIGGGQTVNASEFEIDIPVHTDLFEFISFRLEAIDVGYVQIDKFQYKDIRFKRRRLLSFNDPQIDSPPHPINLGPEEITNGQFTGNADDWVFGSAWTYDNNALQYTYVGEVIFVDFNDQGTGYNVNDILTISGDGDGNATIKVLEVDASGAILSAQVINPGTGYTPHVSPAEIVCTGGAGTGCEVSCFVDTAYQLGTLIPGNDYFGDTGTVYQYAVVVATSAGKVGFQLGAGDEGDTEFQPTGQGQWASLTNAGNPVIVDWKIAIYPEAGFTGKLVSISVKKIVY